MKKFDAFRFGPEFAIATSPRLLNFLFVNSSAKNAVLNTLLSSIVEPIPGSLEIVAK